MAQDFSGDDTFGDVLRVAQVHHLAELRDGRPVRIFGCDIVVRATEHGVAFVRA